MNVDKINFTGSSCTGKTSVFKVLKEDPFFSCYDHFFESISRKLLREKGLKLNGTGGTETQKILAQEYSYLIDKEDCYISERCLIDVCAFTGVLKDMSERHEFWEYYKLEQKLLETLFFNKDRLGLVVYFPIEFEVVKDGERLENKQMRELFDRKIQKILEVLEIEYVTVSGSVENRISQIKQSVTDLKES